MMARQADSARQCLRTGSEHRDFLAQEAVKHGLMLFCLSNSRMRRHFARAVDQTDLTPNEMEPRTLDAD